MGRNGGVTMADTGKTIALIKALSGGGGGSGGGVLVVHMNTESGVLDKTWNEINTADVAVVVYRIDGANFREFVTITEYQNGSYLVNTVNDGAGASYAADSADGYPVHQ